MEDLTSTQIQFLSVVKALQFGERRALRAIPVGEKGIHQDLLQFLEVNTYIRDKAWLKPFANDEELGRARLRFMQLMFPVNRTLEDDNPSNEELKRAKANLILQAKTMSQLENNNPIPFQCNPVPYDLILVEMTKIGSRCGINSVEDNVAWDYLLTLGLVEKAESWQFKTISYYRPDGCRIDAISNLEQTDAGERCKCSVYLTHDLKCNGFPGIRGGGRSRMSLYNKHNAPSAFRITKAGLEALKRVSGSIASDGESGADQIDTENSEQAEGAVNVAEDLGQAVGQTASPDAISRDIPDEGVANSSDVQGGKADSKDGEDEKPYYDDERRELRFRDKIVKCFRQWAERQEEILMAFQRSGWPSKICNPFSAPVVKNPEKSFRQAVGNLNKGLRGIRFKMDGTGEGCLWEEVSDQQLTES